MSIWIAIGIGLAATVIVVAFVVGGLSSALIHATGRIRALVAAYATLLIVLLGIILTLWLARVIRIPPAVGAIWSIALPALVVISLQTVWPSIQVGLFAPFDVGDEIATTIVGVPVSGLVVGRDLHGTRVLPDQQEKNDDGVGDIMVIPNALLSSAIITRKVKTREFTSHGRKPPQAYIDKQVAIAQAMDKKEEP